MKDHKTEAEIGSRMDTMGDGTDSRTAMEERAGSEQQIGPVCHGLSHRWHADYSYGDTCMCGTFYLDTRKDGVVVVTEVVHGQMCDDDEGLSPSAREAGSSNADPTRPDGENRELIALRQRLSTLQTEHERLRQQLNQNATAAVLENERANQMLTLVVDLGSIVGIIDADTRGGEPCPVCSEAPHRADCFVAKTYAKALPLLSPPSSLSPEK